jgi:hypothetical protein
MLPRGACDVGVGGLLSAALSFNSFMFLSWAGPNVVCGMPFKTGHAQVCVTLLSLVCCKMSNPDLHSKQTKDMFIVVTHDEVTNRVCWGFEKLLCA